MIDFFFINTVGRKSMTCNHQRTAQWEVNMEIAVNVGKSNSYFVAEDRGRGNTYDSGGHRYSNNKSELDDVEVVEHIGERNICLFRL